MEAAARPAVEVGIAGVATVAAQSLVLRLQDHPWFGRVHLLDDVAGPVTFGSAYRWLLSVPPPMDLPDRTVEPLAEAGRLDLVFSFLHEDLAHEWEPQWAAAGGRVLSLSSAHRLHDAVPLLVPEVNADHLRVVESQEDWAGYLLAGPSPPIGCLALVMGALKERFVVDRVWSVLILPDPGVAQTADSLRFWEERRLARAARELCKILGWVRGRNLAHYPLEVWLEVFHAPTARVATGVVYLEGSRDLTPEGAQECWQQYRPPELVQDLPSAPDRLFAFMEHATSAFQFPPDQIALGRIRGSRSAIQFVFRAHPMVRVAAQMMCLIGELAVKLLFGGRSEASG